MDFPIGEIDQGKRHAVATQLHGQAPVATRPARASKLTLKASDKADSNGHPEHNLRESDSKKAADRHVHDCNHHL
jgi:hypothetical protein